MKRFFFILSLSIAVVGCTQSHSPNYEWNGTYVNTMSLNSLQNITVYDAPSDSSSSLGTLRARAIRDEALALGAQGGLAWQSQQFNEELNKNTQQLDNTFNFRELLIDNKVIPPVLEQAQQIVHLADPDTIRVADKTYRIVEQARFVTAPPNWRNYLIMNYSKPPLPDRTLLPHSPAEQRVWIEAIHRGWKQGIEQAKFIYLDNLARLKRDYNGMILYRTLLQQNMVSRPYIGETDLGVTNNSDNSQIYINDKVLRITALPQLNPNSKKWHPVITQ